MSNQNSGLSWILILIVIVIISVIIYAGSISFTPENNFPFQITYSLNPTTVKENELATLTFSITNKNETFHDVEFIFNTNTRLKIYIGTEEIFDNTPYKFTIGEFERNQNREFTVTGTLAENTASSQYQINLQVKLDQQILPELSKTIYLTVTRE
jgi:hypothetical protein